MRLPIRRGFPVLAPHQSAVELFRPPDTGQLFRLSAHAVATSSASTVVGRAIAQRFDAPTDKFVPDAVNAAWANVEIGEQDSKPYPLFRDYPMRGPEYGAYVHHEGLVDVVPPFAVFAFVDVGDVDARDPLRPLSSVRETSPFSTQFARPIEGGSELRLHNLVPNVIELVSLHCIIPPQGEVELRFYDGSYKNGSEAFTPVVLKNHRVSVGSDYATISLRRVLDRHPMRGPGSIRALVLARGEESPDPRVEYGFYFSGSTVR